MAKRTRSGRVVGYHYRIGAGGRRYRVYGSSGRRATGRSKRQSRRPSRRLDWQGDTIMGYGGYRMSGRTLLNQNGPPQVRNSKGKGFIVRHREFIQDIVSSTAFVNVISPTEVTPGYAINPGNPALFPWLSKLAENFEQWIPRGIVLEYKTTSTDLAGSAAAPGIGAVIMATDYNTYNPAFGNKAQMENYEFAQSCKPSLTMLHQVETARSDTTIHEMYTRTGPVPAGADSRLYDLGNFQIATVGMQSVGFAIGELWISYEIEFRKPKIEIGEPASSNGTADHFRGGDSGWTLANTGAVAPFSQAVTMCAPTSGSNLGGRLSPTVIASANQPENFKIPTLDGQGNPTGALAASTANTYYFPQGVSSGYYQLNYSVTCTTPGATPVLTITPTNCVLTDLYGQSTASQESGDCATTLTRWLFTATVQVTKNNAKCVCVGTGALAVATQADFWVSELPPKIN